MVIPESWGEPSRYFDSRFIVDCGRAGAPRCVYDVVDVTFRPSATQAERQAAVELVGTLESGSRMTGTYYVRIDGDTSLAGLRNALGVLRSLPQVEWVFPHDITAFKTTYGQPAQDGPAGQRSEARNNSIPDTVPPGLNLPPRYASSAFLRPCTISGLSHCVYDAVSIRFRRSATQAQREAAIAAVHGQVEGWSHAAGEYFIRIPGDTTVAALRNALTLLRSLPQVELAVPYGPLQLSPAVALPSAVPATPPVGFLIPADSINALYSHPNLIYVHPRSSGPYPRAVVLLSFHKTASQAERQAAVDAVGGRVIGGDGVFYLVKVEDDPAAAKLWAAIDLLKTLPQVSFAGPDVRLSIVPATR